MDIQWVQVIGSAAIGVIGTVVAFWSARLPYWAELKATRTIKSILEKHNNYHTILV